MKKAKRSISGGGYSVLFSKKAYTALGLHIERERYSSIYILVDNHTEKLCLPIFLKYFSAFKFVKIIKISDGEENKNLKTCQKVWQKGG